MGKMGKMRKEVCKGKNEIKGKMGKKGIFTLVLL
jgi:hypothetical protein